MGPSINGDSPTEPPMPHHSVRRCRALRVKVTRPMPKIPQTTTQGPAQPAALDYRRPLKIGNIVQTSVNALMLGRDDSRGSLLIQQRDALGVGRLRDRLQIGVDVGEVVVRENGLAV